MSGIRTPNIQQASLIDSVLGNRGGSTRRQPVGDLAFQLAQTAPLNLGGSQAPLFTTEAAMRAAVIANKVSAWVFADPDQTKCGIWRWQDADWMWSLPLPYSVARLEISSIVDGAISAISRVPTSVDMIVILPIETLISVSPVMLSINGGAFLPLKTISGADILVGGLPVGGTVALTITETEYRLISDQAATVEIAAAVSAHATRTDNPHTVTKAQVGLGDVDNVPAADLRDRTTHTGEQGIETITGLEDVLDGLVPQAAIGAPGGVAPLGPDGKVPSANLPADGAYKGVWNAATNSPALASSVGTSGDLYFVGVAGTTTLNGINAWSVGDQLRFNGTVWQRIPSSTAVSSVAGKTGVVALEVADVGGLTDALSGKQAALGYTPVNKSGDTMGGALTLPAAGLKVSGAAGLSRLISFLTSGLSRWVMNMTSGAESGGNAGSDFAINAYTDAGAFLSTPFRIARATGEVTLGTGSGATTALGGMVTTKAVTLPSGTDLDTVFLAGEYRVEAAVNGPFSLSSGQHIYLKVISFTGASSYFVQELYVVNPGYGRPVKWVRRCHNSVLTAWSPAEGIVTPAHYGGRPFPTPIASGISGADDTAAVQQWLDSPWPKVLDGWYRITTAVTTTIDGNRNGLDIHGYGAMTGIRLDTAGRIVIAGADVSNPTGTKFDQITLRDFFVMCNYSTASDYLNIAFADGDSGSAMPTLHMSNVHFIASGTGIGPQAGASVMTLNDVRQGYIENVSGFGRYNSYLGTMINCTQGAGGATVEMTFINVRGAHFDKGIVVNKAAGSTANDDSQGYHFIACSFLAVNRFIDANGGDEGFGEWFTLTRCHAYFREVALLGANTGNWKIHGNYFLGHGAMSPIQGIALTGSSIVGVCSIKDNTIKLDAATGATKYSLNIASTISGVRGGNIVIGAATLSAPNVVLNGGV